VRLALIAIWCCALCAGPPDLARHFDGVDGAFVLLNGKTGQYTRYNPQRAGRRFPPCSTFKIPNSAIALETGAAFDPGFTLPYDPRLNLDNPDWARDHSMRSAFAVSAVWYYQEMARRIGADRMAKYLRQFQYGNEDISGGLTRFWLGASLRISANEQVDFLRRFYEGRLGLSDRATRLVKETMVVDHGPGWTLSGKTGGCRAEGEDFALWYVGYIETQADVHYFALQIGDKQYDRLRAQRKARAILAELGLLPAAQERRRRRGGSGGGGTGGGNRHGGGGG